MSIKRLSGAGLTTPKSNKLWDQTTFQSGMFALATVSLTSTASTITFSNIPQDYTHLQLRITGFGNTANSGLLRFNSDTNTNYSWHALSANATTTTSNGESTVGYLVGHGFGVGPDSTTIPYVGIIDILDYKNTTKAKTTRCIEGTDKNGSGNVVLISGSWRKNTSSVYEAVSTISFSPNTGSYTANSHFALYGIKV